MHINIYYLTEDEKYMCLNLFGKASKRTKKQWITEAILAKIKKESGKEYQEV